MWWLLWLLIGALIGAVLGWFWSERRVQERAAEVEQSWQGRVKHLEGEIKRADQAHDDTKEKLRALEGDHRIQAEELAKLREQLAAAETARDEARAALEAAESERATLLQRQGELERELAEARRPKAPPANEAVATPAPRSADRQRLRAIDAKLRQLPAGSSARAGLLEERAALEAREKDDAAGATEPEGLFTPPDRAPDDLKLIRGVGPALEERLHRLGITTFQQIANFTAEDIARVDAALTFKGRIEREGWVEQARRLDKASA